MRLKSLAVAVAIMLYTTVCIADDGNKVTGNIDQTEQIKILADQLSGLRVEVLNWQKKYYQEKSTAMQLRSINGLMQVPEFIDLQQTIQDLDKKIKQLQLVGGQIQ